MVTTPTPSNGLALQGTGDNSGTWGVVLNDQTLSLIDSSLDGLTTVAVSGPVTLSSSDFVPNEARRRVLKTTGTGGAVTVPGKTKMYLVHNACSGTLTIKTSAVAGVDLQPGTITPVYCDGTSCFVSTSLWPLADGSAASPSVYYALDTNTGTYRIGSDRFGISVGGTGIVEVNSGGIIVSGGITSVQSGVADGLFVTPSLYFTSDPDTGICRIAANRLGITAGGLGITEVNVDGLSVSGYMLASGSGSFGTTLSVGGTLSISDGTFAAPSISFPFDGDTGICRIAQNRLGLVAGGVGSLEVNATGISTGGSVIALGNASVGGTLSISDGTFVAPAISFPFDSDTGICRIAQNRLGLVAGGTNSLEVNTTGISTGGAFVAIGSVTASAYFTSSDYRLKTDIVDLDGSGSFIDALRPRRFTWIEGNRQDAGFIAHEAQAVAPTLVSGEKDAVNEDGTPHYQGVQYSASELIANMVAELQALRARVALLESANG
jgi:hypothetical protein